MCNIWRIPAKTPDLTLSVWTDFLASPALCKLREIDITGGEPFLREDLPDLIKWICDARDVHFKELQTVAITTNGLLTKTILNCIEEVLPQFKKRGIDLVFAFGLDAVGELHDQIRGVQGAWHKLNDTIDGLLALRNECSHLVLGIKTTIIPMNVHELKQIVAYAQENRLFTIISPCIVTANRFGNIDLAEDLKFTQEQMRSMKEFYQSPAFAWRGHRQVMLDYLETGQIKKPCSAGFNTAFVRHSGEVFSCPIIPVSLGNIQNDRIDRMLKSSVAQRFRKKVCKHKQCQTCTEPGMERLGWPFEGFNCLRWLTKLGPDEFESLSTHMGLGKYL
ncbi:MAG: radical SAM protein [Deltaproteobacteria bacterium]|jgi:MoaA/NifB/PqqE/SkfB family radical SAM enzyme|nr:radical SAM protein [Deltaproteobacteria bacterium]